MIFPHLESWSCKHPTLHPQEPLSTCELCTTSPHPAEESPNTAKQHPPQHQVKIQMSNGSWCLHLFPHRWTTTIPICVPRALPKTTGIRALGRIRPPCFLAFLGHKGVKGGHRLSFGWRVSYKKKRCKNVRLAFAGQVGFPYYNVASHRAVTFWMA